MCDVTFLAYISIESTAAQAIEKFNFKVQAYHLLHCRRMTQLSMRSLDTSHTACESATFPLQERSNTPIAVIILYFLRSDIGSALF